MSVPAEPKIYHIVHVDRLPSIITDRWLWCDAEIVRRSPPGTTIGMNHIKQRRLNDLRLNSHPNLFVGDCVPFYFCPRSIMLFIIHKANDPDLTYKGGQEPIIHLEADFYKTVAWAEENGQRWAFTLQNAGACYFEDRCELSQLGEVDWNAIKASNWQQCKEGKQAEFLLEQQFPWELITRIGVRSYPIYDQVIGYLQTADYQPGVDIKPDWYY